MAVYVIKNKLNNKFIDYECRVLGNEGFRRPMFYFSLYYAVSGLKSLENREDYEIEKSEIVDLVINCPESRIDTLQHHAYVYSSWVSEQVDNVNYRKILLSTLRCCQEVVLEYYASMGFNVGFRNFGMENEELIYSMDEMEEIMKGFHVIPKPLYYLGEHPVWTDLQIKDFIKNNKT